MRSTHDREIHIHSWTVQGRGSADKFEEFAFSSEPRDKSKTPSHFSSQFQVKVPRFGKLVEQIRAAGQTAAFP